MVLEILRRGDRTVEVWARDAREPYVVRQVFATSAEWRAHAALADTIGDRFLGKTALLICGESNIIQTRRRTGQIVDDQDVCKKLADAGIALLLNPLHTYMRRPEMHLKRKTLSEPRRLVLCVWNGGWRKAEADEPWAVYLGGRRADVVEEIPNPVPQQPGIRFAIVDRQKASVDPR